MRGSLFGPSIVTLKRRIWHSDIRVISLDSFLTGFHVQCYSIRQSRTSRSSKVKRKTQMAEGSDAFYVVRKGDIVGIYKSLSDCQAQVSSSVCDPPVSVYKGYSLRKDTEEYLSSHGFKDALYSMHASHLKEDMFGTLVPCPFQQPDELAFVVDKEQEKGSPRKRLKEMRVCNSSDMSIASPNKFSQVAPTFEAQPIHSKPGVCSSSDMLVASPIKISKVAHTFEAQQVHNKPDMQCTMTCILEFDGASKGNPGKAGAGAILRTEDGTVVSRIREGLGIATNNVAEYRALILGMKYALMRGFKNIQVHGDSQLVCMQVQGLWQTKTQSMLELCKEVKKLKDMFQSFNIVHVKREFNAAADNMANLAATLPAGEVCEDCVPFE
ncbi:Putative ribonuclease H protein [Apostasia shenzhenica]|uniref:Ribonuclease H protein n=1 Tax=Apostasia shenzhenica TaxID=1088818 RepID=A0A2H9ZS73_9ASPA|nr:Putative ribonuclease H protein [Apostasia shenzhenica]